MVGNFSAMNFSSFAKFAIVVCVWTMLPAAFAVEPKPAKEELAEAIAWFDGVEWPETRGKPYVEIMIGVVPSDQRFDGPKLRGFLIAEDDEAYTVLGDGTVTSIGRTFDAAMWPFVPERVRKSSPKDGSGWPIVKRVLELPAVAEEWIEKIQREGPEKPSQDRISGRKITERTAMFVLARGCAR
jgi:hypothetical protein